MEILAAYDLTRSYRDAAKICGVSHNTVRSYVKARQEGAQAPVARQRGRMTDPFLPQMISWVEQSHGKIRGDVVHEKLLALGFTGCERTTRTALAELKAKYRARNVRVHRPWTPEPGLWLQYDYGDGPVVDGMKTVLFVAWLAFSRFRIVIALRDKTMPSVFAALDRSFRLIGGVPTYVLTDNEKTVTIEHVAGIPVRNHQIVAFARHYSTSLQTCLPADPASKGGVENAVKIAKADLVPKETNLLPEYRSFAELEAACEAFMEEVNSPEPGLWLQYDYGDGPVVDGMKTVLFVAWLAFSRFRIVIALRDKTMPSVFAALDRSFRLIGGVPTYVLTDNEKTVTIEHVAGIPVRNHQIVAFARHYSTSLQTCLPADPASKGGVENAVKIAKADLVPKETNLLPEYRSFAELEAACEAFMEEVNSRVHLATLEIPKDMLRVLERPRLHPVPANPVTASFGQTRQVPPNMPMITFEQSRYSVPHTLMGELVWVRGTDTEVVIVHVGDAGPVEVARHQLTRPGTPAIIDAHFPPAPAGALERVIRPTNKAEEEFLALGAGAALWLKEAAAAGTQKIRHKMERAVTLAKVLGTDEVDKGLGAAAVHQRFTHEDLLSIVNTGSGTGQATTTTRTVTDHTQWLSQGTGGWAAFGTTPATTNDDFEGAIDEH